MQGLGQLYEIEAPSGQTVQLTPEEEAEIIKRAIEERLVYKVNRSYEIERATISAIGNAIGYALGGLLAGLIIGKAMRP